MALGLPTIVSDRRVQQCLDFISRQFPIAAQALADSAKELFPQLAEGGSRKINFGTATLNFVASEIATTEISHGLGVTPLVVIANMTSGRSDVFCSVNPISATKAGVTGRQMNSVAITATPTFYWLAIG